MLEHCDFPSLESFSRGVEFTIALQGSTFGNEMFHKHVCDGQWCPQTFGQVWGDYEMEIGVELLLRKTYESTWVI